jgi:drug/metabolite transporter (DMT)-like permease
MKKLNPYEYMLLNGSIIFLVMMITIIYILAFDKTKINFATYKTLNYCDYLVLLLGAITSIAASILLLYLIKMRDLSYILPHTQSMVITLTMIIGYIFFGEHINLRMMAGVGLILGGITVINVNGH